MTFPVQPQLKTPPFQEAWYHDFSPPIHSLDRHGDFAPPLLALGMAAGFFGADIDTDLGIQFHHGTYGPFNIGDQLDVTTSGNSTFNADIFTISTEGYPNSVITLDSDHLTQVKSAGEVQISAVGDVLLMEGETVQLTSQTFMEIGTGAGDLTITTHGNTIFGQTGDVTIFLEDGHKHEIQDHLGSPLVTYTG